jgi:hypothetical protein
MTIAAVLPFVAWPGTALAVDARVHGLLDVVLAGKTEAIEYNTLWMGDTRFDTYGARIFVDGAVTDRIQVFTQLLVEEAIGVRAMGAYAMFDPWKARDIHVIAGLTPYLVGTMDARAYSDKNPLIGLPLLYQHHTSLHWDQVPATTDELLSQAGLEYRGSSFGGGYPYPGLAVVYLNWWDFGVGLIGSARPFEFALGIENGVPSWPDPTRDSNEGKGLQGRIGIAPSPALRFGVSGAYGPYLADNLATPLAPGQTAEDYNQVLGMVDAEWSAGHFELRGEGYHNTWQTPTVGDLNVAGFYAESKWTLPAGFYVAGRYEIMRFSDVKDSSGESKPWDTDWDRGEVGVGYRLARGVLLKSVYQWNTPKSESPNVDDKTDALAAAQLSVRF